MSTRPITQLDQHWIVATGPVAVVLVLATPVIAQYCPTWLLMVWIQLPVYMIHQCEEHQRDRFRLWVNNRLGGGRELLTLRDVLVINLPGVWGVNAVSLLLAAFVQPGLGLIAVYLTLVNAIAHVAAAARFRAPNPGLWTAIGLFIPAGIGGLLAINRAGEGNLAMHGIGLGTALAIHIAIVAKALGVRRNP
ncbi:MAG: HXXEE domain-containing protein [Planctomycetota bacterium]